MPAFHCSTVCTHTHSTSTQSISLCLPYFPPPALQSLSVMRNVVWVDTRGRELLQWVASCGALSSLRLEFTMSNWEDLVRLLMTLLYVMWCFCVYGVWRGGGASCGALPSMQLEFMRRTRCNCCGHAVQCVCVLEGGGAALATSSQLLLTFTMHYT